MMNCMIHQMNNDSSIRDFLAKEYESGYKKGGYNQDTERLENEIKVLTEQLEHVKRCKAALSLIHSRGWGVWDVSDHISDYKSDNFFPFVGTEAEYKFLTDQE